MTTTAIKAHDIRPRETSITARTVLSVEVSMNIPDMDLLLSGMDKALRLVPDLSRGEQRVMQEYMDALRERS